MSKKATSAKTITRTNVLSLRHTDADAELWNRAALAAGFTNTLNPDQPNRTAWIVQTLRKAAQEILNSCPSNKKPRRK